MVDLFEINDPELRELISSIDSGEDPEHVLLIREINWSRAVAAFIAFIVSAVIILLALPDFLKHDWVIVAAVFGIVAIVIACLGIWLLQSFLNGNAYYVAMNNQYLILRRGPMKCELIPVEEMVTFHIKNGVLSITQSPSGVKKTVIKDAYSKESLETVKDRLKSWRNSPHDIRHKAMQNLNTEEFLRHKKNAIRLISSGILGTFILAFLILLNFLKLLNFNPNNWIALIIIPFQVFACMMSIGAILAGVFLLSTARIKKPSENRFEIKE